MRGKEITAMKSMSYESHYSLATGKQSDSAFWGMFFKKLGSAVVFHENTVTREFTSVYCLKPVFKF